jgi:hypothetical protein
LIARQSGIQSLWSERIPFILWRKANMDKKLTLAEYTDFNPFHEPAGSEVGGQFAEGNWLGSHSTDVQDRIKSEMHKLITDKDFVDYTADIFFVGINSGLSPAAAEKRARSYIHSAAAKNKSGDVTQRQYWARPESLAEVNRVITNLRSRIDSVKK